MNAPNITTRGLIKTELEFKQIAQQNASPENQACGLFYGELNVIRIKTIMI